MALFICSNCGYGSSGWLGKCPDCNQWNTFVQQREGKESRSKEKTQKLTTTPLSKIPALQKGRKKTGIYEFDRVLGGGIVTGEVVLLTGEPGIGKSTLLLQSIASLKSLYISGEESAEQVKERAERLNINLNDFYFSQDLQVEGIVEGLEDIKDQIDIVIIDSIQTVYSKNVEAAPGNVAQLRESANQLIIAAKKLKIPMIMVGHVTKEGDIAGPKTLEHMVDAVLTFEGEQVSQFRILRATKNRFGSTDEIGIFEMKQQGLAEVNNPLVFIEEHDEQMAGRAVTGIMEGKRPLFFEIQTLVSPTMLPMPRRVVKGINYNKLLLLLAVIRKNLNIPLDKYDIYVNVIGGVEIKSPAADLGVVASIISSIQNIPLASKSIFIGEMGLLGEIRKVYAQEKVASEAKRLSFKNIYSSLNLHSIKDLKKIITR